MEKLKIIPFGKIALTRKGFKRYAKKATETVSTFHGTSKENTIHQEVSYLDQDGNLIIKIMNELGSEIATYRFLSDEFQIEDF